MSQRKILVTSALPYANGPLHLGHLVEHIQTDIWVRAQKMLGHTCLSVCGVDAHGTPIMLKAEQSNLSPEALTAQMKARHEADFSAYAIDYDTYHTTHSAENEALMTSMFNRLQANGDMFTKTIEQAYDPVKGMFLPDRFVKGTCPRCQAAEQYGDNCEACGATYAPTELINPTSVVSGATPIHKQSTHIFFDLPKYESTLADWLASGSLQPEVANKLQEWFKEGLMPWDISRDAPYFGFLIPGTDDKYFYVWMDAPVGYMAAFKKLCQERGLDFDEFWHKDSTTELYHFIGKDIIYFHALFWPALLSGSDHRLPTGIFAHGFLTINGKKMSKSRGTFIQASDFVKHLNPEGLRYYFAAKLNGRVDDLDLNFDDFLQKINADLVGKVVNIASRTAGFIHKKFEGRLQGFDKFAPVNEKLIAAKDEIFQAYDTRDFAKAVRLIMHLADEVNQFVDKYKPWVLIKQEGSLESVHAVCTQALNGFKILMGYLKPILPEMAKNVEDFLNIAPLTVENIDKPLSNHCILPFKPLITRVQQADIDALLLQDAHS